jgi:5-methylcytosine-specific restriction endonuclease McrA
MASTFTFPEWDHEEPIDFYKWRRRAAVKRWRTAQIPMMSATRADGSPLYKMTSSGNWTRTAPLSRSQRRRVIARDGACVFCGAAEPFEVDHIVRYVDGGSNELENLRTLCVPCHKKRGGHR